MNKDANVYLEKEIFIRTDDGKKIKRISLLAMEPRISKNQDEAIFGEHCCDIILNLAGDSDHQITISAPNRYDLFESIFIFFRTWVRRVVRDERVRDKVVDIERDQYLDSELEFALGVSDCVTPETQDMVEFAIENGYHRDWNETREIELKIGSTQILDLQSDFGQLQIYDERFAGDEPPEWDKKARADFACYVNRALFLGVFENDEHKIELSVLDRPPEESFDNYLHVVDVPFATTGTFELANVRVKIKKGKYTVRWYCFGNEESRKYKISMWEKDIRKVVVKKSGT